MAGNKRLFVYLAILGLAASRSFALPISVGRVVRPSVAIVGLVVLVGAVVGRRPRYRAGWWLVALSAAWSFPVVFGPVRVDGGALSRVSQSVLVVLGLVTLAAGLGVLGWESAGRPLWNALDASMTALGACLVAWVLFVEPSPSRSLSAEAASIATAAVLVFALAMMLALGGALSTWSGRMLLLACAAALCTSALVYFGKIEAQAVQIGPPIVAAYLAQTTLLGGAGVARDFVDVVGDRRPAPDVPRWRLVLFAVLALLAPVDVAVDFARSGGSPPRMVAVLVPFLYATLILLLLVVRLAVVAHVASARTAEVGHQSASLARAMADQGELQRELAYRALHDPLTGVANRHVLVDRLDRLCKNPCNLGQALIMLDLDGFKDINDTFGHPAGDQILVEVAHRLVSAIPDDSVLVRLGGDEFAILLENTPADEARQVASTVVEGIRKPFVVAGRELFLSASAGLAVTERGANPPTADEGLRDVDQALYAAKESGRNRVTEFHPRLLDERLRHARLTTELRHAISRNELFLHYQPIVALNDGHVTGVEALARWRLPGGEMVPPSTFMPLAEGTGLIIDVGTWVLRQACRDASPWYGRHGTTISVNVSGRQLDDPAFADVVLEALADTGLPGSALVLELTESSLIDNAADPAVGAQLDRLHERGVQVALDDFGTGCSSLSYVTHLPVDLVKIDSSFTPSSAGSTIPRQPWTVVRAVLQLISSLKLSAVAEGIETREQADMLWELQCPYGQGYYFSPPVAADRIDELLHQPAALQR